MRNDDVSGGKRKAKPCRLPSCGRVHWDVYEQYPGSGDWYARVWFEGRVVKRKAGSHGQARKKAEGMRASIAEGTFTLKPPPPAEKPWDPTFAEHVNDYVERNRSRFVDIGNAERLARYLTHAPEFVGKTMRELSRSDAQHYRERRLREGAPGAKRRRGGGSDSTVSKELSFARASFNDFLGLLEDKRLDPIPNPFTSRRRDGKKLYAPESPSRDRHLGSYGEDEADRLFAALPDPVAKAKVQAAILSGIDRGPMFAWRWREDIDFVNEQVRGWRRKGDGTLRYYWVPMVDDLHQLLLALPWRGKSEHVWPNRTNTGHDDPREFVRKVFEPALITAGIHTVTITSEKVRVRAGKGYRTVTKKHRKVERNFRWKDLRHTFGTLLRERGEELGTIGALLGHREGSRMTFRYAHLTKGRKHEAVKRLSGLLPRVEMESERTTDLGTDLEPPQANTMPTVH